MKKLIFSLVLGAACAAQQPVDSLTVVGVEDLGRIGVSHRFRVVVQNNDPQYGLTGVTVRLTWRGATTTLPLQGVVAPRMQRVQVVEVTERDGAGDASVVPAAATFVLQSRSL